MGNGCNGCDDKPGSPGNDLTTEMGSTQDLQERATAVKLVNLNCLKLRVSADGAD